MSFDFNSTQTLSQTDDVYNCLNTWSQKMPSIICKKEETSAFSLTILKNGSSSTVQVKEAIAKHKYKWINEMTSFGCSELSKHYNLEIKGKNHNGEDFIFIASLSYDSENGGRSWSGPYEHSSLL